MSCLAPPNQAVVAYSANVKPAVPTTVAQVGRGYDDRKAWIRVHEAIRKLRLLRTDWDGEGSDAPAPELVDTAIFLVDRFERTGVSLPTTAVASRAGTILFGWRDNSAYQEIEVIARDRIEWMVIDHTGASTFGEHRLPRRENTASHGSSSGDRML
jgi:hypothetical protein